MMRFEKSINRLDEIVLELSDGNTTLERSLILFSEGAALIAECEQQLKDARLTIDRLMPSKGEE